jgi:hypothetical protein
MLSAVFRCDWTPLAEEVTAMAEQATDNRNRLDWTEATMHPMVAGGFQLVVRGVAPVPVDVELRPLPIPIAPVEYHGIEVIGTPRGPTTQVETPWTMEVDADEIVRGTKGFVLIGATMREYFPPKDSID